jgi:hypothetical protein
VDVENQWDVDLVEHYAISIGLTPQQGSVVGALLSLGLCVGRPAVGYFSDALGRINMATIMTGFCGFHIPRYLDLREEL